mgnify:CR=1 FL=1|jgi:hypothetical protein
MSEHLFNNSVGMSFSSRELEFVETALQYLKNDFDEFDLDSLNCTEDEMTNKINFLLWKIKKGQI